MVLFEVPIAVCQEVLLDCCEPRLVSAGLLLQLDASWPGAVDAAAYLVARGFQAYPSLNLEHKHLKTVYSHSLRVPAQHCAGSASCIKNWRRTPWMHGKGINCDRLRLEQCYPGNFRYCQSGLVKIAVGLVGFSSKYALQLLLALDSA